MQSVPKSDPALQCLKSSDMIERHIFIIVDEFHMSLGETCCLLEQELLDVLSKHKALFNMF